MCALVGALDDVMYALPSGTSGRCWGGQPMQPNYYAVTAARQGCGPRRAGRADRPSWRSARVASHQRAPRTLCPRLDTASFAQNDQPGQDAAVLEGGKGDIP